METLLEAYKQSKYQVPGHGKRDFYVLKRVMEGMDGRQEGDLYGNGKVIEDFQAKMSEFLGK